MAGTVYRVIWQPEGYAVEVTAPDGACKVVAPFDREAEAHAWIAEAKWKAAMAASKGDSGSPKKSG